MNETAHTASERETIDELLTVLTALVAMVEASAAGLIHSDTRKKFEPGVSDMAINPEHTLFLSDARAAISKATPPEGTRT